jgi:phosphate transport system substrate-binding protein
MGASADRRPLAALRALCVALVLAAVPAVAVALVPALEAGASGPTVSGTGSSYAALAIRQWSAQIASIDGDSVNYTTSSSVIGLNDFAQYPQVDFGASEIGYSTGQANSTPPGGFNYQYLPDVAGAVCLDYNLSGTTGQQITNLNLSSQAIVDMFTGKITSWNDPEIKALNPGVLLPSSPIIVVDRSDASGDNYIFSDYLTTIQGGAWATFNHAVSAVGGAQAIWPTPPNGQRSVGPYNFGNWNAENGSDLASGYVAGNPGSITYVETGYAITNGDPCAAVQNASGAFVKPSALADAVALESDQLQPDLEQDLTGVFGSAQPQAYAISAYSYLVMADNVGSQEIPSDKAAVEAQFIQFIACAGQQSAIPLGYSPLPENLVAADFGAVQRITGQALPPPTASNCANPTITGSFPITGQPVIGSAPAAAGSAGAAAAATTAGSAAAGSTAAGSGSAAGGATGTAAGAAGAAGASSTTTTHPPKKPTSAPPAGQIAGVALQSETSKLLGVPTSEVTTGLVALVFLAVLAVPPAIVYFRHRRSHGPVSNEEAL